MPKFKKAKVKKKNKQHSTVAKRVKQKERPAEIFDSTVGSTKSLFINAPKKNVPF